MTVKELREILEKLPPDMPIKTANYDGFNGEVFDLENDTLVIVDGKIAVIDPLDLMSMYDTIEDFLSKS